jgi:hypothetical protein
MFTRMPDEYYNEIPMEPTRPMMRSKKRVPQHTMEEMQPVLPGAQSFQIQPGQQRPSYFQDWLVRQIGKYIKVEFLIGTSMLIDREGILKEVGVNYIVLKESGTKDDLMCDLYSIKFVRVFDDQQKAVVCK